MDLGIDGDELASCVACGLCLPHCPTYRVTGDESRSPRGRIAAMRTVQVDDAPADLEFARSVATCVQCRGCEPACPSGVPFGHLMEATRRTLVDGPRPEADRRTRTASPAVPGLEVSGRWMRWGLAGLSRPRWLRAATSAGGVAQRLGLVPRRVSRRLGLPPRLPVRWSALGERDAVPGQPTVWLFTGCIMDAWQRPVHAAAIAVAAATGAGVRLPDAAASCCGALHEHAGLATGAERLANRTMAAFPGDDPIVVDSAGCGAMLKDYGRLLGTPAARRFSDRVLDIHEWLAPRVDRLPPARRPGPRVIVQDPCHLRHVQRVEGAVRTVLRAVCEEVVELDDDGLCCGAGGAYAVVEPALAGAIRERKVAAIDRAGGGVVASANPGCGLHLAGAGVDTRHPVEVVAASLGLLDVG